MIPEKKPVSATSAMSKKTLNIDHVAIAVEDLEASIAWYRDVFGLEVLERRKTEGRRTGMVSAVLKAGPVTVVLVQGTSPESQVSRYIEHYGPGVQHIAFGVRDLPELVETLEETGTEFDTTVIQGEGIRQAFTRRDPHSGMMFELIERQREDGRFTDDSVRQLFEQLEAHDSF